MAKVAFNGVTGNVRGKIGNVVFSKAHNGSTIRLRVKPLNPRTAVQTAARAAMTAASRAFKGLSATNLALWKAYANTLTFHNPVSGQAYSPAAIDAFTRLATKFLQVSPAGTIPITPPTTPFGGDTVTITAAGGVGVITYTASGANTAPATTELLFQPLKSPVRSPSGTAYKHGAFHAYVIGTLTHDVAVPAGEYAAAYRFVDTLTGETTTLQALGVVAVT